MATEEQVTEEELRSGVRELCERYPDAYWREVDAHDAYPQEFVEALTQAGWLAALIPAEYGGAGLGLAEASIVLEEINRSGANGGAGFAREFDVERKFRETRLYQVAPISTNLILTYLAEHVLGLPRSY